MRLLTHYNKEIDIMNNLKVKILDNGVLSSDSTWKHTKVNSPFNRIYFILDGSGCISGENSTTILDADKAYLIPAGLTCNYTCDKYIEKLYLHCNIEVFSGIDIFDGLNKCIAIPYPKIKTQKLIHLLQNGEMPEILQLQSEIISAISMFAQASGILFDYNLNSKYSKYAELLVGINSHLSADLRISNLAKKANEAPEALARRFKKDTGIGLKEYIENSIIKRIKELLITSDLSIKQIAAELDFSDQYYLSRFFKRITGASPSEYRRSNINF